jgi:hypothetical protein
MHFKFNFLKNKLENNRLENMQITHSLAFKLDSEKMKTKHDHFYQSKLIDPSLINQYNSDYNNSSTN